MNEGFKIGGFLGAMTEGIKKILPQDLEKAKGQTAAKTQVNAGFQKSSEDDLVALDFNEEGGSNKLQTKITTLAKGVATQAKNALTFAKSQGNASVVENFQEGYGSVYDIYLGEKTANLSISPSKLPEGVQTQNIVAPNAGKRDGTTGTTLEGLINNAYDITAICKDAGITDKNGIMHNVVDEYLQSNPELNERIVDLYNKRNPDNQISDAKDLSYETLMGMTLYDADNPAEFKVIVPEFDIPMPGSSNGIMDTNIVQKQYSTKDANTSVDIVKKDGTELEENEYNTVADALADKYGLDKNSTDYKSALNTIAFQVANDPQNKEIIETYINQLADGTDFTKLDDNSRAEFLLNLTEAKGLHLPDNVIDSSIKLDSNNYNYTQGTQTYQLSARSPIDGEAVSSLDLPFQIDAENPDKAGITSLEDILKYSYDPRPGEALKTYDEEGNEVLNINDQAAKGLSEAYMLNSIKDNPDIYAAAQEINGEMKLFGSYDINQEAIEKDLGIKLDDLYAEAQKADENGHMPTAQQVATKVHNELVAKSGGSVDNFIEKYGSVNLDTAKDIELYDENGNIRFKNSDGTPVKYNMSETYVRFGTAAAKRTGNSGSNGDTPSPSTTPSTTPSTSPSTRPSTTPSTRPSTTPSTNPSTTPSTKPSTTPSTKPSTTPSSKPSTTPSTRPSTTPSTRPSTTPSTAPSTTPSTRPSTTPSTSPSTRPSTTPSTAPSTTPSTRPSTTPSTAPSTTPSTRPSTTPSSAPSTTPSFNPPPSITEPDDPKPSTTPSTAPSTTPSSSPSTAPVPSDCPPPPPPSNPVSNTLTNTTTTSSKTSTVSSSTPTASNTATTTSSKTSTTTSSAPTSSSTANTTTSSAPTVAPAPAPAPPPSTNSSGSLGNTTVTGGSSSTPGNTENKVNDSTSEAIKGGDDVEHRKTDE